MFPLETEGVNLNADESHLDRDLQILRGGLSDRHAVRCAAMAGTTCSPRIGNGDLVDGEGAVALDDRHRCRPWR